MNAPAPATTPAPATEEVPSGREAIHAQPLKRDPNTDATFVEAEGKPPHADPTALYLNGAGWVSLAMLVVVAIVIWKRVPAAIGAALDKKIAGIRAQLDEASRLRAEAEAIRAEYEGKAAAAASDAASIVAHAHAEAQAIVAKAKADAETLVERRGRMAEDKIAAAERTAIAELRAKAASAAATAAATLLEQRFDATTDKDLVDRTISGLGQRAN